MGLEKYSLRDLRKELKYVTWPDQYLLRLVGKSHDFEDEIERRGALHEALAEVLVNGEGLVSDSSVRDATDVLGSVAWAIEPGLYYWVKITNKGKRLCTLYQHWAIPGHGIDIGEDLGDEIGTLDRYVLKRLFLVRDRRGLPPVPSDVVEEIQMFDADYWRNWDYVEHKPYTENEWDTADGIGSRGIKGQLPVVGVQCVFHEDGDHVWHFPRYKVRSTKLASALTKIRTRVGQEIELDALKRVIARDTDELIREKFDLSYQ